MRKRKGESKKEEGNIKNEHAKAHMNDSACDEFSGGSIKSIYMRFMFAVLLALLASTLITTVLVYGLRSVELSSYVNDQVKKEFDLVNAYVVRYNLTLEPGEPEMSPEEIQALIKEVFGGKYNYMVFSNLNDLITATGSTLKNVDLTGLDREHVIIYKNGWFNNMYAAKIGSAYVLLEISNTGGSLKQIWFNVIWTTGLLTLIVALIINSLTIKMVIKPIKTVSDAMQRVARGDFDVKLDISGSDEISVLQRNFNTMTEGLKQNDEMSKNFASIVSHEYKTPITAITGYVQLLSEGNLTEEERQQYFSTILEQSRRLSNLSVNMLRLARLDSNTVGLEKNVFRLDEQIRNVVVNMESLWEAKSLEMDIELDDARVFCNEQMLYQVWENLLSNAIKFTPKGNKVRVSCTALKDKVYVTVTDTGCGISPKDLPHIFERFYKSDSPENSNGSGLGLAITQRIVELSGGSIAVESAEGQGSTFTVVLPLTRDKHNRD